MNLSAWSGWHTVIAGLAALYAAELKLVDVPALAAYITPAELLTVAAISFVGIVSGSAVAK